jgi:hypothetical protein
VIASSVVADSYHNMGFYNSTKERCKNDNYYDCRGPNYLVSRETFEYVVINEGIFGYHSMPHAHMHGTVGVLSSSEELDVTALESQAVAESSTPHALYLCPA